MSPISEFCNLLEVRHLNKVCDDDDDDDDNDDDDDDDDEGKELQLESVG